MAQTILLYPAGVNPAAQGYRKHRMVGIENDRNFKISNERV